MPINMNAFPMREFRKSRDLIWDPAAIDFSQDKKDWQNLTHAQKEFMLRLVVGFLIGERGVTHDLAPLQQVLRRERGRMEEEMYLTAQLFEEAKHVEFFQLWMNEVLTEIPGGDVPYPVVYGNLFSEVLPEVMQRLNTDPSPAAQLRATTTYHIIVEGVLGETGYQIFYGALEKSGLLPGLNKGIHLVQRDEVRHIAFGTYLCQRLLKENPDLEPVFDDQMEQLREVGTDMPNIVFGGYSRGNTPFGLDQDQYGELNRQLFRTRMYHVKKGQLVLS